MTEKETPMADQPIHLMIPRYHPGGYAAYVCDLEDTRVGSVPMRQRTLDPAKATCPDCLVLSALREIPIP